MLHEALISELIDVCVDGSPERRRLLWQRILDALTFTIEDEGAESTRVHIVHDCKQHRFVEFERIRELANHLPHTVNPEEEDGRHLKIKKSGCWLSLRRNNETNLAHAAYLVSCKVL